MWKQAKKKKKRKKQKIKASLGLDGNSSLVPENQIGTEEEEEEDGDVKD